MKHGIRWTNLVESTYQTLTVIRARHGVESPNYSRVANIQRQLFAIMDRASKGVR